MTTVNGKTVCRLCISEDVTEMFNGVWWCPACKIGFVPEAEVIKRLAEYRGGSAPDSPEERDHKQRVARQIMGAWNSICNGLGNIWTGPVGTMLEVGFGNAGILREFHRLKWNAFGLDPDMGCVQAAYKSELSTAVARFDEPESGTSKFMVYGSGLTGPILQLEKGGLDLLVAWDSFEHMTYIRYAFHNAAYLLKTGGLLAIHSPLFDRYSGDPAHGHCKDRSHFWHMTKESAERLAQEAGFEINRFEEGRCWGEPGYCHPQNFCMWAVKK